MAKTGENSVTVTEQRNRLITVEPIIIGYFFYLANLILLAEQYVFSVVSQDYNYTAGQNDSVPCGGDNASSSKQQLVQSQSSLIMLTLNVLSVVCGVSSLLFLGAYSDVGGRKVPLMLPLIGAMMRCTVNLVVIHWQLSVWYLAIGSVLDGFTGSTGCIVAASFSYIADVTSSEKRSLRITILDAVLGISYALCQLLSGFIIVGLGYYYGTMLLLGINILNAFYVALLLPETRKRDRPILEILKCSKVFACGKLLVSSGLSKRRVPILLNFLILSTAAFGTLASMDAITYFLKGKPLCFSAIEVGLYTGGSTLLKNIFSLIGVTFLTHFISELWLLSIGCFSAMSGMVFLAFVSNLWMGLISPWLSCFAQIVVPLARSVSSKLVEPQDQGALFAGLSSAEAVSYLVGTAVINTSYSATLHILPGFVFIIIAIVCMVGLILSWAQIYYWKKVMKYQRFGYNEDVNKVINA